LNSLINWDNLKPYNSNQNKSFEELCYQIAFEIYLSKGKLTSIDDSGGGDGVEFYLELPNGDIWGWQCKFFGRFNEGGRKEQIKSSLQRAFDKHGTKLKKWVLCSRLSLTSEERIWFTSKLSKSKHSGRTVLPAIHSVDLEHWGETILNNFLRKYPDIHRYFFTDKILDFNWFKNKFTIVANTTVIKSKYLNGLHVKGEADKIIIQTLADARLSDLIEESKEILEVDSFIEEYKNRLIEINKEENIFDFKEDYKKIKDFLFSNDYSNIINKGDLLLKTAQKYLIVEDSKLLSSIIEEIKVYKEELLQIYTDYSDFKLVENIPSIHWDTEENEKDDSLKRRIKDCRNTVLGPYFTLRNYIDAFINILNKFEFRHLNELHISGHASKGKTHLAANIVEYQINQDKPAIFLFGKDFRTNNLLKEQLKTLLDLPTDWSVSDFLGALNIAGRINNTKAVLLIDGLNESIYWKQIWGSNLELLINEINQFYPNILLITTYRRSYEQELFPHEYFHLSDDNWKKKVIVDGFDGDNLNEAVERYFEHYDIKLLNSSGAMYHFSEPLYLKIFCEAKQGQKVSFQNEDLFDVFDQYLQKSNKNVVENSGLSVRYNKQFSKKILSNISCELWSNSRRDIDLKDVIPNLIDEEQLRVFEGEDLLIFRDWGKQEIITFTYDLLSGYLIAQILIQDINSNSDLIKFIESAKFKKELIVRESLHPLYNDILRCFCVLIIKKLGLSFYNENMDDKFKRYIFNALFEVNTAIVIKNKEIIVDLVSKVFKSSTNRDNIFKLFTHTEFNTEHPLNFDLLSNLLFDLSISDRDISWTEYIRKRYDSYSSDKLINFINDFENVCKDNETLSDRIHLASKKVMWLLTSTNREMRDNATKALYHYGIKYVDSFLDLMEYSLSINDPYVWERMLVNIYGIILSKHNDWNSSEFKNESLRKIGVKLYNLIFSPNAPFSTTHILARDYARRSIEISLQHHPDILTKTQKKHIHPPYSFGGIRNWGEHDYGERDYGYNEPIRMDFSNYTIGKIVLDGHSYSDPPEKKKVRRQIYWRIYSLGWDKEKFKKVEEAVGNQNYRYSRTEKPKVERYGKKYSWIAFYEIYGYREDNDLVKEEWPDFRPSESDIDPTFPELPENNVFIKDDLLGDRKSTLIDWYNSTEKPKLDSYLTIKNLNKTNKEWICLDGFISQKDKEANRDIFVFVRGMFVKSNDYNDFKKLIQNQNFQQDRIPRISENYYTYAGEMNTLFDATNSNINEAIFEIDRIKKIVRKGDKGYFPRPLFNDEGIKFDYPEEIEIEESITKNFEILLPVAQYNWESYHSSTNKAGHQNVPSKEISSHLGLINVPQTFNLFEKNGALASLNVRYYTDYNTNQHFVYLRKDLFDKFLTENNYKFIWGLWGEKQITYEEHGAVRDYVTKNSLESYKLFKEIKPY
jgi:hypothetical protein